MAARDSSPDGRIEDALGSIVDATAQTYRPDVLFDNIPLSPLIEPGAGGWTSVPLTGVAASGDSTGLSDASDVQASVERQFARLEGEHRRAQAQARQRAARPIAPVPPQQAPWQPQQVPQPPAQQAPWQPPQPQQASQPQADPRPAGWPAPNIPPMGVPRSPNPLGRAPQGGSPPPTIGRAPRTATPAKRKSPVSGIRTAVIAVAFLFALGSGLVGAIGALFESVTDGFGISGGSSGGDGGSCLPTLDSPELRPPSGEEPVPAFAPALPTTVRLEVVSADAGSAGISVYGDTPDYDTCDVDLPWAAEAAVDDAGHVQFSVYPPDGASARCRVYLDDALVTEQLLSEAGGYCAADMNQLSDGDQPEGEGTTGDLEAVPASTDFGQALPDGDDVVLEVDASRPGQVETSTSFDDAQSEQRAVGVLPVRQELTVPPGTARVRSFVTVDQDQVPGVIRCRLLVGGVPVVTEAAAGFTACRLDFEDLAPN